MFKLKILLISLLACTAAYGQVFQRELGDYDLKLGTSPSRSMAQGLVKPSSSGSFHGGLDLSHDSGWYAGQWAPSMGLSPDSTLEVDSYLGFVRKVGAGRIAAMIGWRPAWQSVTNSPTHRGN